MTAVGAWGATPGPAPPAVARQYVAVSTGRGGTSGHFQRLTPELRPSGGNTLFVFALPVPK